MSIFDMFKKNKEETPANKIEKKVEVEKKVKPPFVSHQISGTSFSRKMEEEYSIFEYIEFNVAGTSFHQENIERAIKLEDPEDFYYLEKYDGETDQMILEKEPNHIVYENEKALFSESSLRLEPDNEHDSKAIAVYIDSIKVGYVPEQRFEEGKAYIYEQLTGGLKDNQTLRTSVTLSGGKYKITRDGEKIETGHSDYKLHGQVVIKTPKN